MNPVKIFIAFLAGLVIASSLPHLFHGILGQGHPTPFGEAPFHSLSSPLVNILWGLFSVLIGLLLFTRLPWKNGIIKSFFILGCALSLLALYYFGML